MSDPAPSILTSLARRCVCACVRERERVRVRARARVCVCVCVCLHLLVHEMGVDTIDAYCTRTGEPGIRT